MVGQLPFHPATLGRWWRKGTEIDLVGADHERRHCLVGECKYHRQAIGLQTLRSLQAKCDQLPVADDAVLDFWIFSRMGFEHALLDAAQSDPHLHLVGMWRSFLTERSG
ncbi:MAG: hypothetical protein IJ164_07905 [Duodenibacillus sp.]|nr:hypothetical protein [Duodenibacillus sp.]